MASKRPALQDKPRPCQLPGPCGAQIVRTPLSETGIQALKVLRDAGSWGLGALGTDGNSGGRIQRAWNPLWGPVLVPALPHPQFLQETGSGWAGRGTRIIIILLIY